MNINDCFELGYISRLHGFKGEVLAILDTKFPDHFKKLDSAFLSINGQLVPYFIKKITINRLQAIIRFEEIDTDEKAIVLKGSQIFLPLEKLPPLAEDDFFLFELIDFKITDKNTGELGIIHQIYNLPNNDLMAVYYQSAEVLIPINEHFIVKIDKRKKALTVDLPDGFLEVYTHPDQTQDDGDDE